MRISAIVPATTSAATETTLTTLLAQHEPPFEILLAAPANANAATLAKRFGVRTVTADTAALPALLNTGARAATGDVFLFACPPAQFPPTATQAIQRNLSLLPTTIGGSFHLHFHAPFGTFAAKMAKMMRYRQHYDWDSGIFIRAETFAALGGISAADRSGHQFARRLEAHGATVYPPDEILLPAGHILKLMWRWLAVYPFTPERKLQ